MAKKNIQIKSGKIKKSASFLSYRLGITQSIAGLTKLFFPQKGNLFNILNYHRVNNFNDPFTIDSVNAVDFENQIKYIAKYYNILSLEDIYYRITANKYLPKKSVAITFDDGYEDNYIYAYKILKKYDLPATIFLTVDCIDSQIPLWFDNVLSAFKITDKKYFISPIDEESFNISDADKKLYAAHKTLEKLKKMNNEQRKKSIAHIIKELNVSSKDELSNHSKLLNWEQIKEMSCSKISFGSHTMTHPILSNLSLSDIEWELKASKKIIEQHIGKEVGFLAYPNGKSSDYNETAIQLANQIGYKAAVTTLPNPNNPSTDFYNWGRYKPWQNKIEHFSMALFLHDMYSLNFLSAKK